MINCEMGSEDSVIGQLKPIQCVKEIAGVFGNYDVLVKMECPSVNEISEAIATKIRKLEKIRCTTTLMCSH